MKKTILLTLIFSLMSVSCLFAKTYDLSQISNANPVTSYSEDTTVDQMDTVTFGSYPQSDESGNIKEPIEWLVLEKQADRALLLSKYILDSQRYTENYNEITDWEKSTIRTWLNNNFYNVAFNNSEKNCILSTEVINNIENGNSEICNNTNDKIFLLGWNEVQQLPNNNNKGGSDCLENTEATNYVKKIDNSLKIWWLRDKVKGTDEYAWGLNGKDASKDTFLIKRIPKYSDADWDIERIPPMLGVRPAMWVSLNTFNNDDSKLSENNEKSNVKLKVIDVFVEGNDTKAKVILEDKANVSQYTKEYYMDNGDSTVDFYLFENGKWKHLSYYDGLVASSAVMVYKSECYNKELTFTLPEYIMEPNTFTSFPTLSKPINGHFKLKYFDHEVEFDIKNNSLSNDKNGNSDNNLINDDLNSMSADEIHEIGKKYQLGDGVEKNYDLAKQYYEVAAAKGKANSFYNIGSMIMNGYISGTKEEARQYFQLAGDKGLSEGYYAIGWNILMGKLEGTNEEGMQYLERAATLGNENAKQILKMNNNESSDDIGNNTPTLSNQNEMGNFTGLKDGYYYLNGVKLVNKWVEIEGKGYYFDSDGKNYKFNP